MPAAPFVNAEGGTNGQQIWMLNQATVDSVNLYFANLEQQVGLCNVVKTAVDMGMTRADGTSLLQYDPKIGGSAGDSADNFPSFTLGSVYVSPMSMAAAYASVAARGWYCSPQAITKIQVITSGQQLPVQAASVPSRHAAGRGRRGQLHPAGRAERAGRLPPAAPSPVTTRRARPVPRTAASTRPSPVTRPRWRLTCPCSTRPIPPVGGAMLGSRSCYRDLYGENCPGQMFGDNAPGATWEYTFLRADLGPDVSFVTPPGSFFSAAPGLAHRRPSAARSRRKARAAARGGGGGPTPTPTH